MIIYHNPLDLEMKLYLDVLKKSGRYSRGVECLFRELDVFIPKQVSKEEALSENILFEWDRSLTCSPVTRKKKHSELRGFMNFLQSTGLAYRIPEIPRTPASGYAPYIFCESEWNRIILEVDNLATALRRTGTDMPIVFPMLVRILYTCGLRVSEALSLRMEDIDFNQACLTIRKAKRKRQRLVPMRKSTSDLLLRYCTRRGFISQSATYIFACTDENPPSKSWVQRWFNVTLNNSGIQQTRRHSGERGICPHCIRHTFTFRSFQNSSDSFENTVPFLSTYLGHENIMETDRYLRFSYELYSEAHEKISDYTEDLFPEVDA